jgi:hypothetical protein
MPLLPFAHPPRAFLFGHCEWFFSGMKRARDDRESNAGDYQVTFHHEPLWPAGSLSHPKVTFVTRLRPGQSPSRAARQLPDLSTIIRVESSSTDDSRRQSALPRTAMKLTCLFSGVHVFCTCDSGRVRCGAESCPAVSSPDSCDASRSVRWFLTRDCGARLTGLCLRFQVLEAAPRRLDSPDGDDNDLDDEKRNYQAEHAADSVALEQGHDKER